MFLFCYWIHNFTCSLCLVIIFNVSLREFHFVLLISLWPGSLGFISLLVSSGIPCQLTIPICILVLCYILAKWKWTELNALLKFEIPASWNFKRVTANWVSGLRFPLKKKRSLISLLLPTLNGKLPFAYWKRVGKTVFPDGAITITSHTHINCITGSVG